MGLSACAQIKIQDQEYCADAGKFGATCAHTLKPDTRDIPKEAWDKERFGQVCMTGEVFKQNKIAIESLCHAAGGMCTMETKKKIDQAFSNISRARK